MLVTITTLEMLSRPVTAPRPFPEGIRLDRATEVSPEYARFLYGLVGGPWHWTDRIGWSREQWRADLEVLGTEFLILYGGGVPLGYVHLQPIEEHAGTSVEIRYFGLAEQAIGQGLGGRLLEHAILAAWTMPDRHDLWPVRRVWLHTCSLDGPAALSNYQARGLQIIGTEDVDVTVSDRPLGSWVSTGGPASDG